MDMLSASPEQASDQTTIADAAGPRHRSGPIRARPWSRTWWWQHRATITGVVAVVLAVAGSVAMAAAGTLDGVPLLDPAVAATVEATGAAVLVASWSRSDRRWLRRRLPLMLIAVAVTIAATAGALWVTETVTDPYPPSFLLWVGLGLAALAACPMVLRWAGDGVAGRLRRVGAVLAVPLTLAGALLLIDDEYGIWPQLGDVLGHSEDALSGAELRQLLPGGTPPKGKVRNPGAERLPRKGVIAKLDAPSTRSHFRHRPGVVYLPPAYFGAHRQDLPVLIMMVGAPGTPTNWLRAGAAEAADDAYAAAHHGVAPVLVIVDHNGSATGDTECVDGPHGNSETYLTVDVPAFITTTLGMPRNPHKWGVVGFSEGGTCALGMVLGHPDVYQHLVDLAGDPRPNLGNKQHTLTDLYGGSVAAQQAHEPAHLLATRRYSGVTAWFAAGVEDPGRILVAEKLAAATTKAGIVTHEFTGIGGHNWQFARDAFARILAPLCDEMR
jgi:S-formylglutathione hydrolase FrmB